VKISRELSLLAAPLNELPEPTDAALLRPKPFLRWAGGKAAIAREILPQLSGNKGTYFEPFLGAGAIFFSNSEFADAQLGDLNRGLIEAFEVVRDDLEGLADCFGRIRQSKEDYYEVRSRDRDPNFKEKYSKVERAARFVYLNSLCFNGLYRENSSGYFNVPLSDRKFPVSLDLENLNLVRRKLAAKSRTGGARVSLSSGHYSSLTASAKLGDVVYFDPPYAPLSSSGSFVSYQAEGFSSKDQEALRDEAMRLTRKGVRVIVSNSNAVSIRSLYSNFDARIVMKNRPISGQTHGRKSVEELIIDNRSMLENGKLARDDV